MATQKITSVSAGAVFVEWDPRYALGISLIDEQHQELIRLTNELYNSCLLGDDLLKDAFSRAVKGTVDYVKYHFSAEEKLLENARYPDLEGHKKLHAAFVKQILDDVINFETGKKFVPNTFVRFLKDWILSHIAVEDKKYAEYIFSRKKQGESNNYHA
ncbi:hemerythrin [Spirochaetia bacterium]|nr:hemerythrin [Spirochaetia bacterium]